MELLVSIGVIVLGLIVGSFLNVVILRIDTGLGFGGRSKCFSCGKDLAWYELVPVFSFLAQKGKCRGCKGKISVQYPLVELITTILFYLIYKKFAVVFLIAPLWISVVFSLALFALVSSLIIISVFDIHHKQIPTVPLLLFYAFVIGSHVVLSTDGYLVQLIHGVVVASPFLALWAISRGRWLGFGDVLLALGIGWWLGLSSGFAAVLLSFWIGAAVSIVLMIASKKHSMKTAIPFGPFLALGALLSFLYTINIPTLFNFFSF
jgi:prepilin signal peptidase PulO-like enzyme (type II secretory pathway)